MKRAMLLVAGVCLAFAPIFGGCGGAGNTSGFVGSSGGDATADGTSSGSSSGAGDDGSLLGDSSSGGRDGNMTFGDGSTCPSTCKALGADCGAVTDTKCGGVIQCGSCPTGRSAAAAASTTCAAPAAATPTPARP